jgi:hypothetical protein
MTTIREILGGDFTGETITATTQFSGSGAGLTSIPAATALSGQVSIGNGGTGQNTASTAFNALSPLTTKGDILAFSTSSDRMAVGSNGQTLIADSGSSSGISWINPNSAGLSNVGLSVAVSANALTITLTQADGSSAPSTTNPSYIYFRAVSSTSGSLQMTRVTSSLSLTIPSGKTIGTPDNYNGYIYIYLIQSGAGAIAASLTQYALDNTVSTVLVSSGVQSPSRLYSTASISFRPIQYIGKIIAPQATAGTWVSAPTEIYVNTADDYAAGFPGYCTTDTIYIGQPSSSEGARLASASNVIIGNNFSTNSGTSTSVIVGQGAATNIGTANMVVVGQGSTGNNNAVAIGQGAFSGASGVAIGYQAKTGAQLIIQNVSIGASASNATTQGSNNVVVGYSVASAITTGSNSIIIGSQAGTGITTGGTNIIIGYQAATQVNAAATTQSVIVGPNTTVGDVNLSGCVSVGYNNTVSASNQIIIGNNSGTGTTGFTNCIVLGNSAAPTAANQLVIGSSTNPMSTVTSATAGSASALPALPSGYLNVLLGGTVRRIPYYN